MDQDLAHMVAASKVPMFKPGEYELWRMRIEQYIQMIDYSLWEHRKMFNSIKDAKSLLQAIEKSSKVLDQTFDRLQKLISQLEIHGESISQEDVNHKFLRSLAPNGTHRPIVEEQSEIETVQMAMLIIKARRVLKNTGRKFSMNGTETIRFDKSMETLCLPNLDCHSLGGVPRRVCEMSHSVSEPTVKKPLAENSKAKISEEKPKAVRKNNGAPIIEEWVSDSREEDVPQAKIEKKTIKFSFAKIEFVKSKKQVKSPKKTTVKQVNAAREMQVVNAVKGYHVLAVNGLAYWVESTTRFEEKGTKASVNAWQARKEKAFVKYYILLPLWTVDPPFSQDLKSSQNDRSKPSANNGKKVDDDPRE
ncbi:hypothetical protein Tco_1159906 [Tanacetum coccineum]